MKTTIIYHKDGTKTEFRGKTYQPSYDSYIDKPMSQRLLDNWYKFECEGSIRPTDIIKSKAYMRDALKADLACG